MPYNEEQVSPKGDLNDLAWGDSPTTDSLGASVDAHCAFRVRTREELALVLESARSANVIVRPAGALTSSKAFIGPPPAFMKAHNKSGIWLVGFDPSGEFGEISVDMGREEVTVGAAVSLQQMNDAVAEHTRIANGSNRPRLTNLMRITTMDALAVATALGSGGVSDDGHSSISTMTGSNWMDGRGVSHRENYDPSDYFGSESSSFARVNHLRVGLEMSGRGGPFGIGLSARFRLGEAPVSQNSVIFPFYGQKESVREQLAKFVVEMNQHARVLKDMQSPVQVASMEFMDIHAMNVASQGTGTRPFNFPSDPACIVIVEFAQFDFFDTDMTPWASHDAAMQACDANLIPEAFYESMVVVPEGARQKELTTFRLQGPEHMRSIYKARKREIPLAGSESTDWAVDPTDETLVRWYLGEFFTLYDGVQKDTYRQALYGHLFRRLDLHHRVIVDDPAALYAHTARSTDFGRLVAERQKQGERVRVRGEKVELPFGRDLENIGKLREGAHRDSNVNLLNRIDPNGLFLDRAPERWGGNYQFE